MFKDDDGLVGVMNFDGEVLIKPRYFYVVPLNENYLTNDGHNKWWLLNKAGQRIDSYDDCESILPVKTYFPDTKFELIVYGYTNRNECDIVSYDGVHLSQYLWPVSWKDWMPKNVVSDYINVDEVSGKICELIDAAGVAGVALASPIYKIMATTENPSFFSSQRQYKLPDIIKKFNWTLDVTAYTDETISIWDGNQYKFNPSSLIQSFDIFLYSHNDIADELEEKVKTELVRRGFEAMNEGTSLYERGLITPLVLTNDRLKIEIRKPDLIKFSVNVSPIFNQ